MDFITDGLEITIEIKGYENDEELFAKSCEDELMGVLSMHIDFFGLPKQGQIFFDGNMGVRLDSLIFSKGETPGRLGIDFTFSVM